jgi:hypothetical protein
MMGIHTQRREGIQARKEDKRKTEESVFPIEIRFSHSLRSWMPLRLCVKS